MQNSTLVWVILAALVILSGGWYFLGAQAAPEAMPEGEEVNTGSPMVVPGTEGGMDVDTEVFGDSEESTAPMSATIVYSSGGFSPSVITVRAQGTVTWQNQGGGDMWVASAQHPTHTVYDGTTLQEHCGATGGTPLDQCSSGTIYSFTFTKAGTWRYHNHSNASHFGTVIVEE